MKSIIEQLEAPAHAMGIPAAELAAIVEKGQLVDYEAGACLFHESTPRQWFGVVTEGEIEIVRGLQGRQTHLATLLIAGSIISEGLLLDECAHSSSALLAAARRKCCRCPQPCWNR